MTTPIYIPTNNVGGFPSLHTLFSICGLWIFWWWPFWGVRWYPIVVLIFLLFFISYLSLNKFFPQRENFNRLLGNKQTVATVSVLPHVAFYCIWLHFWFFWLLWLLVHIVITYQLRLAEETINYTKWQSQNDWEKIFANDVTNKRLVSNIYKQLMRLNIIKTNNSMKNGQKT